jgi:hypothetical protein
MIFGCDIEASASTRSLEFFSWKNINVAFNREVTRTLFLDKMSSTPSTVWLPGLLLNFIDDVRRLQRGATWASYESGPR